MKKIVQSLQQVQIKFRLKSDQGFSLIEALIGVLVITVVLLAVTPPIILTMATQVQNRRAEQAMQLAQGEIDRVRTLVAQGDYCDPTTDSTCNPTTDPTKKPLPDVPATFGIPGDITSAPPPNTLSSTLKSNNTTVGCSTYTTGAVVKANQALQVDLEGKCKPTFLVQTFRDALPQGKAGSAVMMFHMGVRVYSAQAINGGGLLDPANCASLQFTNGLGGQQSRPLAVIYTTIARSDQTFVSLNNYSNFLTASPTSPAKSSCQ